MQASTSCPAPSMSVAGFGTLGLFRAKAVAMKAETTLRPLFPAWPRALRRKWARHPCRAAQSTLETAALMPSCASEKTSFTPRRPRRVSPRRNSVQIGSASDAPISKPGTWRRPAVFTPGAMMTATETIRPPHLEAGGVDPEVWPVAFERAGEERLHLAVDIGTEPADLAYADPRHPHGLDQIAHGPRRDALNMGHLDCRRKRSPALADRWRSRAHSPPCAAVREGPGRGRPSRASGCTDGPSRRGSPSPGRGSHCAAPAVQGPARRWPRPSRCRPPAPSGARRKADHLAQQIGIGGLLDEGADVRHARGHRWSSRSWSGVSNQTSTEHRR